MTKEKDKPTPLFEVGQLVKIKDEEDVVPHLITERQWVSVFNLNKWGYRTDKMGLMFEDQLESFLDKHLLGQICDWIDEHAWEYLDTDSLSDFTILRKFRCADMIKDLQRNVCGNVQV